VLVVLDAIDADVVGSAELVTVEEVVVVEDTETDEGVTTVVGVLADEQETRTDEQKRRHRDAWEAQQPKGFAEPN